MSRQLFIRIYDINHDIVLPSKLKKMHPNIGWAMLVLISDTSTGLNVQPLACISYSGKLA